MRRALLLLALFAAVRAYAECTPAELFRSDDITAATADDKYVYAATGLNNSTIWRIHRTTGSTLPLAVELSRLDWLSSDGTTLTYVTTTGLRAESVLGGQPRSLVPNEGRTFAVPVSDGAFVYWIVMSTPLQGELYRSDGEVRRAPLTGGVPIVIASGLPLYSNMQLSVDDNYAYILGGERIVRVPKAGGEAIQIATGPARSFVKGPADSLWWVTTTTIGNVNIEGFFQMSELAVWRLIKGNGEIGKWEHRPIAPHGGTNASGIIEANGRIVTAWWGSVGLFSTEGDIAAGGQYTARQIVTEPAVFLAAGSDGISIDTFLPTRHTIERLCDPLSRRRPSAP